MRTGIQMVWMAINVLLVVGLISYGFYVTGWCNCTPIDNISDDSDEEKKDDNFRRMDTT
jgi:hypothetical protein